MIESEKDLERGFDGSATPAVDQATHELVGLLAFSTLAAMTRLAKDGDQAPNPAYHIEHARMSAHAFREFQHLEIFAERNDFSLVTEAGQFAGLFDELDARTRPSNWWERSVKTYVVIGIFSDSLLELNERHQLFDDTDPVWDFGQGAWVREHLAPLTQTDPQLASRLSLWARRVAGESFGLLRATLFTYPELALDPDTVDAVVAETTKKHQQRMEALGLKA